MLMQIETNLSINAEINWNKSFYWSWYKLKQIVLLMLIQTETKRSTNADTNWNKSLY